MWCNYRSFHKGHTEINAKVSTSVRPDLVWTVKYYSQKGQDAVEQKDENSVGKGVHLSQKAAYNF